MQLYYNYPSKESTLFDATDFFLSHRLFSFCILFQDLIQVLTLHLFSCHLGLLQPWESLSFSLFFTTLRLLKSAEWLFCRTSTVGSSYVLSWLHGIYAIMYFSVYWIKGTLGQSALLLIMLTFILKVGSSSFFPAKLLFFPLQFINNSFRVDALRLWKSLLSLNSVHKCQHLSVVPACSKFYWVFQQERSIFTIESMFVYLFCFYQNGLKDIYFTLWIVLQYYHLFTKLVPAKATRPFVFLVLKIRSLE